MKPTGSEQQLVNACLQWLRLNGRAYVWRQNQGAVSGEYKGKRRFIRFAGAMGISDIIGCSRGGRLIAVECKVGANKPSAHQVAFLDEIRNRGGFAAVVYSLGDLERAWTAEGMVA